MALPELIMTQTQLSLTQVFMLNSVVCGLEFCASAAFTYIPPMLLKAGLSEENMSFVLGIGPFLGFLLVPWIGRSSDNCRSRYGRRRPYILALSLLLVVSLVMIPYGDFFSAYMYHKPEKSKHLGVILLIIGAVLLDFTSQATLTPCEALLSDACRNTNQQDRCFMVYSFMVSIGGCIGYLLSALDWSSSAIGLYFGSQERSAFSMLILMFSVSVFFTLAVAQEKPIAGRKRNTGSLPPPRAGNSFNATNSSGIEKELDELHKSLLQQKDLPVIPAQDPGYESGSNHSLNDDYPSPSTLNSITQLDGEAGDNNEHFFSILTQRTISIPLTRFSVSLGRFDSFCYIVTSRLYRYLPSNLKTLYEMPTILRRLAVAHYFSWSAVMAFNLFFTDFVGQSIYHGNPNADENSLERALFDEGVRMGSWGLLFHCITSAIYAFFVQRISVRWGIKMTYVIGMVTFTIAMALMVFTTNIVLVNILAACTGIAFATLTTVPYILLTKYHESEEIFFYDVRPDGHLPPRGMGTDMASLDAAYFLSQVVLSAAMGYIVHLTGSVLTYVICAAAVGAVSCACILRIVVDKKDVTAMLKR